MKGDLAQVAIVGAGTMGTLVALRCAVNGKTVRLHDASAEARARVPARLQSWIEQVSKDHPTDAPRLAPALSRIQVCDSLAACVQNAHIVVEMVPERLELKRAVWGEIAKGAPENALLATSSSSLPNSRMADVTGRPRCMVNTHFSADWGGAPVEVMGNPQTLPETLDTAISFVSSLGLLPVRVKKEVMGLGLNTIWHEIKRAALRMADGYIDFEDIDRYWILGHEHSPVFADMDRIGLDVVRDIEMQYYADSGDERDRPPAYLDRMIEEGRLGVKTGRGFYTYPNPEYERPGWLRREPPWTPQMALTLD